MLGVVPVMVKENGVLEGILAWLEANSYNRDEAIDVASRIHAHKDLWMHLVRMVDEGTEPKRLSVDGFTYARLRNEFDMTPVGALLMLAWIKTDPMEAKRALEYGVQ